MKIWCFDVSYENKSIHFKTEAKHYEGILLNAAFPGRVEMCYKNWNERENIWLR